MSALTLFRQLLVSLVVAIAVQQVAAADLGYSQPDTVRSSEKSDLRLEISRYLSLLEIRATFDVIEEDEILTLLTDQVSEWKRNPPSDGEKMELSRLLLAEGSYYLVGLRFLVFSGGAAFPSDRSQADYINDTLVQIDALERQLVQVIANGDDETQILLKAERIRALTEGFTPSEGDLMIFSDHEGILASALLALEAEERT